MVSVEETCNSKQNITYLEFMLILKDIPVSLVSPFCNDIFFKEGYITRTLFSKEALTNGTDRFKVNVYFHSVFRIKQVER